MGPAPGEIVVEGEVERVTFENVASGFRVIKLAVEGRGERLAVVGVFPPVAVGARVRVRGTMGVDRRHGEQLRAASVMELQPNTLVGIERYLGSGMIKGIGETYAKRIVTAFGLDTLRVLDEAPARLHEVEGLGRKRIESIERAWAEQRAITEVMVFLQSHGASPVLAARIFRRYGTNAISVVSRDPYRLALDVWGVGFKTSDRVAASLGIARDSPERVQAGVLQTLHDVTESGHVCASEPELVERARAMLELETLPDERMEQALESLAFGRHIVRESADGVRLVYPAHLHAAEVRLSERLVELACARAGSEQAEQLGGAADAIVDFEHRLGIALAPEQRAAVEQSARARVLVITGGPGVGKTTIVQAILALFDRAALSVRLAAPTGRASKRMAEATGREALTLHRLLEFDPKFNVFRRDRARPLDVSAVVVDEASMIDLPMADALTQALAPSTRLVLVGDVDQLPSVGPGAVLRDIIASRTVACARLTQIFRQAARSLIVVNAHRVNGGEPPLLPEAGALDADFFLIDRRDPEAAKATILELVTNRIPRRFGLNPVRDVQVLTPMHRGPVGSVALNEALQAALNPGQDGVSRGARTLRAGDKVMQLRNDYERNVWNGDVGVVTRIEPDEQTVYVGFNDRGGGQVDREVAYDAASLDDLSLAYACSVHKSQGSEYPAVVIAFLSSHFVMLSRNLLYTAVTRGKKLVVLVADPRAISLALAEDRNGERRTQLTRRLVEQLRDRVR